MVKNERNKGITLIALVITIIVLLILAGVAISAISGNENTMGKAQESREKSKAADELDSIKLAVVNAKVQGSYDLNVDQQSLKEGLEGIVDNPEEVLTNADSWIVTGSATKKLYTITKQGEVELVKGVVFSTKKVEISPSKTKEITVTNVTGETLSLTTDPASPTGITVTKGENNKITITTTQAAVIGTKVTVTGTAGTESDTFEIEIIEDNVGAINALIGKTVNYTAPAASGYTGAWQVFYADEANNEVFIISKDIIETKTSIGNNDILTAYSDGAAEESLLAGTYGRKYNSIWLGITNAGKDGTTVNNNAKSVAYLCDASTTGHWAKYAGGTFGTGTGATTASTIGKVYAVGGATIELLAKSVTANPNVNKDYSDAFTTSNVTTVGYPTGSISGLPEPYKAKYDGRNYGFWWLASPSRSYANGEHKVNIFGEVSDDNYYGVNTHFGVRPLVSIPLSSFDAENWINQN